LTIRYAVTTVGMSWRRMEFQMYNAKPPLF